jgi:hypothetical protein
MTTSDKNSGRLIRPGYEDLRTKNRGRLIRPGYEDLRTKNRRLVYAPVPLKP